MPPDANYAFSVLAEIQVDIDLVCLFAWKKLVLAYLCAQEFLDNVSN